MLFRSTVPMCAGGDLNEGDGRTEESGHPLTDGSGHPLTDLLVGDVMFASLNGHTINPRETTYFFTDHKIRGSQDPL